MLTAGAAAGIYLHVVTAPATPPPPPVGFANVWYGNPGTCTPSATPLVYNAATSCSTPDAAFAASSSNYTVGVNAGSYAGNQAIAYNASLTSWVTFVPYGTVAFQGQLCIGSRDSVCGGTAKTSPDWVKFDATGGSGTFVYQNGVNVEYRTRQPTSVTFNGGHTAFVNYFSVANLTISNMDVGPGCCSTDGIHGSWQAGTPQDVNLVFANNHIHGMAHLCANYPGQTADGIGPAVCPGDTAAHVDAIQFDTGNGITVSGNTLDDTSEQGIFFGGTAGGGPTGTSCPFTGGTAASAGCYEGHIVIENNSSGGPIEAGNNPFLFGRSATPQQPDFSPTSTWDVRYNSTVGSYTFPTGADKPAQINFVGNIGDYPAAQSCANGGIAATVTFSHNWFATKTCGATDTLVSSYTGVFTDIAAVTSNLHLVSGAPEIGGGDPASFPTLDIDGGVRRSPPDAGSDQYGVVATTGSGGSGLASGEVRGTQTEPLNDTNMNPLGTNATLYFYTYKPSGLNDGAAPNGVPLVIDLVGSAGSGCLNNNNWSIPTGYSQALVDCNIGSGTTPVVHTGQLKGSGWEAAADANGFILAAPGMSLKRTTTTSNEYTGGYNVATCGATVCATDWYDANKFITDVRDYAKAHANIDLSRIYLVGDSAGGNHAEEVYCLSTSFDTPGGTHFSETAQTGLANSIAGIGFWSGGLQSVAQNTSPLTSGTGAGTCNPPTSTHPVSIIHVHGTSDSIVSYAGNCAAGTVGASCTIGQANERTYWLGKLGCSSTATSTGPTTALNGSTSIITESKYSTSCAGGKTYETEFASGVGHDTLLYTLGCTPGTTSCVINAAAEIYAFLVAH